MSNKRITVIGHANVDVLAAPVDFDRITAGSLPMDNIVMSCGGGALNEAVILKRLGAEVNLVSKVGADEAGEQILNYINNEGISTYGIIKDSSACTSVNVVLVDAAGERYFLTNSHGANRKMDKFDIWPFLDMESDIVSFPAMFVSPLLDTGALSEIFKKIKSRPGRILAVDMTKPKNCETLDDLKECLKYADYIFPNEAESCMITGKNDPFENAKLFADTGVKCVVIKRGAAGCLIYENDRYIEIPAYPVVNVTDTTGAGDSFVSGFLYGLCNGYTTEECGRFGNAVASCVVEGLGAAYGVESAQKTLERFKRI